MKKIGINLIIGFLITTILIVISLLVIKPNFTYMISFNDKIYTSKDANKFSYDNNDISFSLQDNKLTIDVKKQGSTIYYEDKIVYFKDTGYTAFLIEDENSKSSFSATITFSDDDKKSASITKYYKELTAEQMIISYKYANLINAKINKVGLQEVNNDKINVTNQKIICCILSVFIGFILSFLVYPYILFEKLKETKKLVIISVSLTLILCLSSGFYIFFTLK